jgi:hypothetical protein
LRVEEFLLKVVEKTDGWVIVVVFALFVAYHCYKKYVEFAGIKESLSVLRVTIESLLKNLDNSIGQLTSKIEAFLAKNP